MGAACTQCTPRLALSPNTAKPGTPAGSICPNVPLQSCTQGPFHSSAGGHQRRGTGYCALPAGPVLDVAYLFVGQKTKKGLLLTTFEAQLLAHRRARCKSKRILTWGRYPPIRLRSPSGLWPDNLSLGTTGTVSDAPPADVAYSLGGGSLRPSAGTHAQKPAPPEPLRGPCQWTRGWELPCQNGQFYRTAAGVGRRVGRSGMGSETFQPSVAFCHSFISSKLQNPFLSFWWGVG